MIDTARSEYPADMLHAAHHGEAGYLETVTEDLVESVTRYAQEQPITAMLWALGVGVLLGWKLRRW
ncbi:MAG: hypothetical protein JWN86_2050 [Planctomycetota bacterium]|nr:hypothetical protein [Planctomycetota bacterium]